MAGGCPSDFVFEFAVGMFKYHRNDIPFDGTFLKYCSLLGEKNGRYTHAACLLIEALIERLCSTMKHSSFRICKIIDCVVKHRSIFKDYNWLIYGVSIS